MSITFVYRDENNKVQVKKIKYEEAKNKEEAVDICMAGRDVDENNPDYTNDIIEIYQEELHYVGGEK